MLEQHGVGRAEFGDFVQAAADKVAGDVGVACGREVGGFAVDDGLVRQNIQRLANQVPQCLGGLLRGGERKKKGGDVGTWGTYG